MFDSNSLAAVAIAAHEAGHAMQDKIGYPFLVLRTAMVPITTFGSRFGYFMLFGGLILVMFTGPSPIGLAVGWIGLALFSTAFVFALVTLPVEFDASRRGDPDDGERARDQRGRNGCTPRRCWTRRR